MARQQSLSTAQRPFLKMITQGITGLQKTHKQNWMTGNTTNTGTSTTRRGRTTGRQGGRRTSNAST